MKKIVLLALALWVLGMNADTPVPLAYGYDASGNRTSRHFVSTMAHSPHAPTLLVGVDVSPRVTTGSITINVTNECPIDAAQLSYELTGLQGNVVAQGTLTSASSSLSINGDAGIYLLNVYSDNLQCSFKLIKTQ